MRKFQYQNKTNFLTKQNCAKNNHKSTTTTKLEFIFDQYDELGPTDILFQGGYLEGIRSHLGGLTQRVKSWYWGRPLVSCI